MTFEKAKDCMTNYVPVLVSPEYLEAHFSEFPELREHPCFIAAVRSDEADLITFDNGTLEAVALCMIDMPTKEYCIEASNKARTDYQKEWLEEHGDTDDCDTIEGVVSVQAIVGLYLDTYLYPLAEWMINTEGKPREPYMIAVDYILNDLCGKDTFNSEKKKIFKTVIQVEILSEYMYSDLKTLADIHYDITDGECSGLISTISLNEVLIGEEAVKAVQQHGSGIDFFGMDEDGYDEI